jgi:hypothetical protein
MNTKFLIVLAAALTLWACQRADHEPVSERTAETAEDRTQPGLRRHLGGKV